MLMLLSLGDFVFGQSLVRQALDSDLLPAVIVLNSNICSRDRLSLVTCLRQKHLSSFILYPLICFICLFWLLFKKSTSLFIM